MPSNTDDAAGNQDALLHTARGVVSLLALHEGFTTATHGGTVLQIDTGEHEINSCTQNAAESKSEVQGRLGIDRPIIHEHLMSGDHNTYTLIVHNTDGIDSLCILNAAHHSGQDQMPVYGTIKVVPFHIITVLGSEATFLVREFQNVLAARSGVASPLRRFLAILIGLHGRVLIHTRVGSKVLFRHYDHLPFS